MIGHRRMRSLAPVLLIISAAGSREAYAPTAEIVSLTLVPQTLAAGSQSSGSIRLDVAAAITTDAEITNSHPAVAVVPASVSIPPRTRTVTFAIRTAPDAAGCTRITARLRGGVARSADLFVLPRPAPRGAPVSIRLESNTVVATGSVLGHVELARPAGEGGTVVVLASSNAAVASVAASILVPPGVSSQRFVINTSVASATACTVISAAVGGSASRTLLKIVGLAD